ncbi:patatin-like phospholipase family protein [Cryptosporidium serpentis]
MNKEVHQCAPVTAFVNRCAWPLFIAIRTLLKTIFSQKALANLVVAYVVLWYINPSDCLAERIYGIKGNTEYSNGFTYQLEENNILIPHVDESNQSESKKDDELDEILAKYPLLEDEEIDNISEDIEKETINKIKDMNLTNQDGKKIYSTPLTPPFISSFSSVSSSTTITDSLFNLNPTFEKPYQDASPSKCYILSTSGGGARGSFSAGLIHGLSLLYRYHSRKLRWDVFSGVSIGSLNTYWSQFYMQGQEVHTSTESASVWENFSYKNVHNCKSTIFKNIPKWLFRLLKNGTRAKGYLCSSYPMLLFMRHLTQSRPRYKERYWSAVAYSYNLTLPYFFNEEMPIGLLPSIIRTGSSYPGFFPPADLPGLGIFGDGGLSRLLDIRNAIHRCFQSGKAKTDKDIVIDIVSTSYISHEHFPSMKVPTTVSMFEGIGWYFNRYSGVSTFQQYEIVQALRRYPNIKFRHFLSHLDAPNSIIHKINLFDFIPDLLKTSLWEGIHSGFYNATTLKDFWKSIEIHNTPEASWKIYGDARINLPNSASEVSNPDTDAYVEYPSLKEIEYSVSPTVEFINQSNMQSSMNEDAEIEEVQFNHNYNHNYTQFDESRLINNIIELHRNLLVFRYIENIREFVRERDEVIMRRSENMDLSHNIGLKKDFSDEIESIPFFKPSRLYLYNIEGAISYANIVKKSFYSRFNSKLKFRKMKRSEAKIRKLSLDIAIKIYNYYHQKLLSLYNEYNVLMEPLNNIHLTLFDWTKNCANSKQNKRSSKGRASQIPLLYPFIEGKDGFSLIWAPYRENLEFKEMMIHLMKVRYPNIVWKNPPDIQPEQTRRPIWNKYKLSMIRYLKNREQTHCWMSHPKSQEYFNLIETKLPKIREIQKKHEVLINTVTNYQILICRAGMMSRYYTAQSERIIRKNFIYGIDLVESIFLKTSSNDLSLQNNNFDLAGHTEKSQFERLYWTIKQETENPSNTANFLADIQLSNILPPSA